MSKRGNPTVTKHGYRDYILSPQWKSVKIRYLKSKLPKECFVCFLKFNNSFHFHHRTYKNLGNERLLDIVPVCRPCHQKIHYFQEKSGLPLWTATTKFRRITKKEKLKNTMMV